jgi:hypothetical protein
MGLVPRRLAAHSEGMARFDVVQRDQFGRDCDIRPGIEAGDPAQALMLARQSMAYGAHAVREGDHTYAVYRRRRVRGRRLVGVFMGPGDDDGLAGVREPRRPKPTLPSLRAEADLPAYPEN